MPKFTSHVFICGNQRPPTSQRGSCDPDASGDLVRVFREELKRVKAGPLVRANKSGCLDQCEWGPTVAIYPQAIWYGRVRIDDVRRIVEETILGGRVIEELRIPTEELNAYRCGDKLAKATKEASNS
jgi:(2Fe-2S) ferredoxin